MREILKMFILWAKEKGYTAEQILDFIVESLD